MKYFMCIGAVFFVLSGCSSTDRFDDIAHERDAQKLIKMKNKSLENNLNEVPRWVTKPPRDDSKGIFSVGIGEGESLDLAMKKAHLNAEFGLAKRYKQTISGSERFYTGDNNVEASGLYVGLIDKIVENVPVVGYSTVKQQIKTINGQYHAFVLLKLPYDEFNKVLREQRTKESDTKMKEAFEDLEQRLKNFIDING